MDKQQEPIRLAAKIVGLVSARTQNFREKKPELNLRFRIRADELQNEVFDTFILRVDWDENGCPKKKIYLCLVQKNDFQKIEKINDTIINLKLQETYSLYEEFRNILIISREQEENLNGILDDVDAKDDYSIILYSTDIALEHRCKVSKNNSPVIGTFEIGGNGGVCITSANDEIIKNALSGRNQSTLSDFVANLVLEDARIDAPDLSKLVTNALQEYLWTQREWPHASTVVGKYLDYIEDLWGSQNILSGDSIKLNEIVRNNINGQQSTIPCADSVIDLVSQQIQNHEVSYVIVRDIPPILRCSRIKEALTRTSDKFLIVTQKILKEWHETILRNICENQELCTDLVLSVVSIDSELQNFLQSVRLKGCHVRVVSPTWRNETHELLESFASSYTPWTEMWSKCERDWSPELPLRRLPGSCGDHGALFESKMAALVALRARRRRLRFRLHANAAVARPFDDLVLRVEDARGAAAILLVQLKHTKDGGRVPLQSFLSQGKGDYSLSKYFQLFQKLCEKYERREELENNDDWLLCSWKLEDFRYIIYTNKEVEEPSPPPRAGGSPAFPFEALLETGNGANTFSFQDGDEVWNSPHVSDASYRQQFLPRLRVFGSQSHVQGLDALVVRELNAMFSKPLPRAQEYAEMYLKAVKQWMDGPGDRVLSHSSGELEAALGEALRRRARAAAGDGALAFQAARCASLRRALAQPGSVRVRVCVPEVPRGHRAAKVLQVLDEEFPERWMYVDAQAAGDLPHDALRAVAARCRVVVLDVDAVPTLVKEFVADVAQDLKLKLVVLSSQSGQVVSGFPRTVVCEEFLDDWRLEHLVPEAQDKMMDRDVNFQGARTPLRVLQGAWPAERLRADVDGPLLSALVLDDAALGVAPPPPDADEEQHHVPRTLTHASVLRREVLRLRHAPRDHLVLRGFSREELELEQNQEERRSGASRGLGFFTDRWTVLTQEYGSSESRMMEGFYNACVRNPERNVHLVENSNGTLLWRVSDGSSEAISKFVVPWSGDCKKPFTATCNHEMSAVESAVECSQRVCLLLGEPGIGKTSFLCSLAEGQREKAPEEWAVVVKLLDHVDVLAALPNGEETDRNSVLSLLAAAAGVVTPASTAARRCLKAALFHTGAVHVFVDGVDEVMPTYREVTLRLLELLVKETKAARVWVAARPEVGASLRRMLPCGPMMLLPLSRDEQLVYLRSKCLHHGQRQAPDAMERVAKELLNAFAFAPGLEGNAPMPKELDRRSLLSVPLNLRLVVDAFAKDIKIAIETNSTFLPARVNQLDIFERFIENQRERYRDRYGSNSPLRKITNSSKVEEDEFLPLHMNFAMLVWTSATVPSKQKQFQEFVEKNKENLTSEKTGILWQLEDEISTTTTKTTTSARFQFAHYTIVEYLVAKWLFENRENSADFKQLFEAAYNNPRSMVMVFLDLMLAKKLPVHKAIIENDAETLASMGVEDRHEDLGGRSALHVAAAYGCLTFLYKLLEAGCDLSLRDSLLKWTALQYASATEKLVAAEILLEQGAKAEELKVPRDILPVYMFDLVEVLRAYLQTGRVASFAGFTISFYWVANVPELSVKTLLPLLVAAEAGSMRIVRLMLEKGTDINITGNNGATPVHAAALAGHEDMVDLLLSHGANVHCRDIDGFTPLHYACAQGHEKVVKLLLMKDKELINLTAAHNYTPLHVAANKGQKDIVEFLVEKGANLMSVTSQEHMPIHIAAQMGHEQTTEYLLRAGADIHCRGQHAFTPLHYACERGHVKVVQLLLSKGADVSREALLRTPLYEAAARGHVAIVKLLLAKGADANRPTRHGFTPLHAAIFNGHSLVVVILLFAGVSVNVRSSQGQSALHLAAARGHKEIVQLLLSRGADAYQKNTEGYDPIQ